MKTYNEYTFFYGGPFSNWYPAAFEDVNGTTFNCSEQYMMYYKAILFKDTVIAKQIMIAQHPSEQKALGKMVRGFDKEHWQAFARTIVLTGCFYKFTQNKVCNKALEDSAGTLLVEASPTDTIWGIGLSEENPLRFNQKYWRGTNWLGEVLTVLRESLFYK
jgi:ribA/ribD-fused uncharacterized protein